MNLSHVLTPFGWPIVTYLTLAGLACGACLSAVILMRSNNNQSHHIAKTSLWLAAASIVIGAFFLITDLEAPSRFYLILTEFNTSSVISWGARIITIFAMLCVYAACFFCDSKSKYIKRLVMVLLVVFALGVGIYPALVLGQATARPLWDSLVLIPLFLLSGCHSGFACLQLVTSQKWSKENRTLIKKMDVNFIILQIVFFVMLMSFTSISSEAKERLFYGEFALWLWGGVVFIGWALPLLDSMKPSFGKHAVLLRQLCFLWGSFALRAVIILGGQGAEAFLGA